MCRGGCDRWHRCLHLLSGIRYRTISRIAALESLARHGVRISAAEQCGHVGTWSGKKWRFYLRARYALYLMTAGILDHSGINRATRPGRCSCSNQRIPDLVAVKLSWHDLVPKLTIIDPCVGFEGLIELDCAVKQPVSCQCTKYIRVLTEAIVNSPCS